MGLEAPLALLGLATAVLPWLAHRIRRRDMPVVRFPMVNFLITAKASQRRSHNLTDLLLLVSRICLLAALCMALSAPYVTARVSFGDGEVSSAVIVIDDSMSMQREYDGTTLLARAVDRGAEAIAALPEGSEVAVVLAGHPPRTWLDRSKDLRLALSRLREIPQEGHRATALTSAVEQGIQKLTSMAANRRRLLVLSDFAEHTRFDATAINTHDVQVLYEPVAPAPKRANLAITAVSAAPAAGEDGRFSLAVAIKAFGDDPPETADLRVTGPGDRVQTTRVPLTAGAARAVVVVDGPRPGGDPRIRVELQGEDPLAADNRRDLLLGAQAAVRVLLVNGDPHPADARDELHYISRALALSPPDALACRVSSLDAAMLEHYDLAQADVVVLANVSAPAPAYVHRLQSFVEQGGGLVVAMGGHTEPGAYNAVLEELLGAHFTGVERLTPIGFDPAQVDGSLLPAGLTGLQQAQTNRRMRVDATGQVKMRYADGAPAVVTHEVGRGTTVLWTTSLDEGWSDTALRPGFLALAAGLVRLAAGERADIRTPEHPGDQAKLPVPPGATLLEVVAPDDVRHRFDDLSTPLVTFKETQLSGAYRVLVAGDQAPPRFSSELSFMVEPPDDESDLGGPRLGDGNEDEGSGPAVAATLVRKPLTRWFLLVAAVFGLVETGLRTFQGRKRRV